MRERLHKAMSIPLRLVMAFAPTYSKVKCVCVHVCMRLWLRLVRCNSFWLCRYTRMNAEDLPPLLLIYTDNPSDSGAVHSPVRQRWLAGDVEVRETMDRIAHCAEAGKCVSCSPR
jgi:hypothetical protein